MFENNNILKKDNRLIYALFPKLDIREARIVSIGIAQIKTTDKKFKPFKIPIKEIVKGSRDTHTKINNNKGEEINLIDHITDNLMNRTIKINNSKISEDWIKVHMVQWCKYNSKGYIEILFAPEMSQFLLQLNEGKFTKLDLNIIYNLKNHYTVRLYEIIKNNYDIVYNTKKNYLKIDIIELLSMIGAKGVYLKWNKFSERILKPAQKLFEKYSDLTFTFNASAEKGKAFDTIIIYFKKNKNFISDNLIDADPLEKSSSDINTNKNNQIKKYKNNKENNNPENNKKRLKILIDQIRDNSKVA